MPDLTNKDFACLTSILDAIEKIEVYTGNMKNTDDFYNDSLTFDATLMNFIVIGEMVERLSEGFKNETSGEVDWHKIRGFRNIIAHNYFGVDAEEVWQIIKKQLVELKTRIKAFTG